MLTSGTKIKNFWCWGLLLIQATQTVQAFREWKFVFHGRLEAVFFKPLIFPTLITLMRLVLIVWEKWVAEKIKVKEDNWQLITIENCKANYRQIKIAESTILCFRSMLIRAYGGCLDTKRRWRTLQGAISFGEVPSNLWPGDFPMGKPITMKVVILHTEFIGVWRRPGEVKHLSNQRKRKKYITFSF